MQKKRFLILSTLLGTLAFFIAASAPAADDLQMKAAGIFRPLPTEMSSPENPLTPEKITLGRMLYYEP